MTGRQVLEKSQRRQLAMVIGGLLIATVSMLAASALETPAYRRGWARPGSIMTIGVSVGIAFIVVGAFWGMHEARCLWCRMSLFGLMDRAGKLDRIRCCPYCGTMLDDEAPAEAGSGRWPTKGRAGKLLVNHASSRDELA
jgi:hypothetical protein